jgi:hypothetical protein
VQTARDREIVDWIGRLGAASADHVMHRFGMGRTQAYARLSRLVRDGLLEQRRLLYGEPGLYLATAEGLRWCGLARLGTHRIRTAGVVHACQIATVAVELTAELPGWSVLSEREIRSQEVDDGELLGSGVTGELAGGRRALHRADLLLVSGSGRRVAVELELSVKARRRLLAICRGWGRARHVAHIYYLAAPAAARAVRRAVRDLRAEDRITVLALDETSALAASERGGRR